MVSKLPIICTGAIDNRWMDHRAFAMDMDVVLPHPRPNTPGLGAGVQWGRDGGAPSNGSVRYDCAQQYVCKSQSCMVMLRQAIAIVTELAADAARASGEARAEDVARRRAV